MTWNGHPGSWRQNADETRASSTARDWSAYRKKALEGALAQGLDMRSAQIAAEGTIRELQAEEEGRPVFCGDVERELEALYESVGAAPSGIVKAKAKVMSAARQTASKSGCSLEHALFYTYSHAVTEHKRFLLATQASEAAQREAKKRQRRTSLFVFPNPFHWLGS